VTGVDTWLEALVRPPRGLAKTTLILCRTRASAGAVRRWIARRGGLPGVDVATPHGLALQTWQPPLLSGLPSDSTLDAEIPTDSDIYDRIGSRPGLTALARRHTRALRAALLAGPVSSTPAWLRQLVDHGWATDATCEAQAQLLERARSGGLKLSSGYGWDRLVLVGFELEPTRLDPWTRGVVEALGGRQRPPAVESETIAAIEVPDVTAEARKAAQLSSHDPNDTLILVSEVSTARRVRDALRRNDIPCAWRDNPGLHSHALASAVTRCTPWFTEADPPIRASDLAWVLGRTALGRRLHPAAQAHLDQHLDEREIEASESRLTRNGVVQLIKKTRLLDAPLSRWIATVGALDDPRAPALHVRLQMLRGCIQGEALEDTFPSTNDTPMDDFDDIVAQLLDDGIPGEAPPPQPFTLGALKAYLLACRVRIHDDPAAVAILGALKRRGHWRASGAHVTEALSGTIDPGVVATGVDVLTYDDYDGRPSRTLLLLDVHDKGLARRPATDPLLSTEALRELGVVTGRALVEHRIAQTHRARANAASTVAVITRLDPGGREVVPPIQLDLSMDANLPEGSGTSTQSHGLNLNLPEITNIRALSPASGHPQRPHGTHRLSHLATQATAEWYREGRGARPIEPPAESLPKNATLAEHLAHDGPLAPDWLMGLLGYAEEAPEAALPADVEWSHSRLFKTLSHCLYQSYLSAVLKLRKPQEVSEDLDPREIGDAVHDALEAVGPSAGWRTDPESLEATRDALVSSLRAATSASFAARQDAFGEVSEARQASIAGQVARWNAHWPSYALTRVQREVAFINSAGPRDFVRSHPLQHVALLAFRATLPDTLVRDYTLQNWLSWAIAEAAKGTELSTLNDEFLLRSRERREALPNSYADAVRTFVGHPSFLALVEVHRSSFAAAEIFKGLHADVAVEVPFGSDPTGGSWPLGSISIELGRQDTALRGRIDRMSAVRTGRGLLIQITDYKTGRFVPSANVARSGILSLREPQLLLYGLAVREAIRKERVPEGFAGGTVSALGYDHIRNTLNDKNGRRQRARPMDPFLVDDAQLNHGAEQLGQLLDEGREGRWALAPRGDTCPSLSSWRHDYCPYAGACRLRGRPPKGGGS
jgi:hypothetical protein